MARRRSTEFFGTRSNDSTKDAATIPWGPPVSRTTFLVYSVKATSRIPQRITSNLDNGAMQVTAHHLAIGYHNAAHITQAPAVHHTTPRQAALICGQPNAERIASIVKPVNMIGVDWRQCPTRTCGCDAEDATDDPGDTI
jgi:hypothetical protein